MISRFPSSVIVFAGLSPYSFRVVSRFPLAFRAVFDFCLSCFVFAQAFLRREHRSSFGFSSSCVFLRSVRLRSLARSFIALFTSFASVLSFSYIHAE